MRQNILVIICILFTCLSYSQDDLLDELEKDATETSYELPAFKAMRIANLQSTKMIYCHR